MKRSWLVICLLVVCAPIVLSVAASAEQVWINDILVNPARYWNRTVTVIGQVQAVKANPEGTTRGFYTILDDSCPNPITVRSNELPPLGKSYAVTGVIIQDPAAANVPILKEVSRSAPGMASTTLYLLIGAGVVFLVLLITFIVLLTKPKKAAAPVTIRPRPQDTVRPGPRPVTLGPDLDKTTKLPTGPAAPAYAAPAPDKTQVFMSLGADLIIEKGPDKGKEFTLHKQVMTIGRPGARKNDVELADDTVSKDQASIFYDNTRKLFSIANESATNPTKVNGQIISGPTLIENGALIEMGRTIFRFKKD
ncbi:MAG: FHA domain-containing protein [Candidatus Aminicenantes bacterium]|nr:FHA domain-containing protein [Candidatus Aminicenantes bacterium]